MEWKYYDHYDAYRKAGIVVARSAEAEAKAMEEALELIERRMREQRRHELEVLLGQRIFVRAAEDCLRSDAFSRLMGGGIVELLYPSSDDNAIEQRRRRTRQYVARVIRHMDLGSEAEEILLQAVEETAGQRRVDKALLREAAE